MTTLMRLNEVMGWVHGARLIGQGDVAIARVHTDSRTLQPGDLFVALRGEHFDANDLLAEAQKRGAVAALCHLGASANAPGLPCIEVDDTQLALGELATHWRAKFKLPLIAVTGSNGKTTVTQMVAAILQAHLSDGGAFSTRGNLNNEIGVPLTLLGLRAQHQMAVVELGMNHPGEIALLAAMAQPTVALVNNAQREHLEFMHTVEAVAQENGAVISALAASGTAVFPADDAYAALWHGLAQRRTVRGFSMEALDAHTDCLACISARWESGAWEVHARGMYAELNYRLAIAGRHNVKNSLAAAACALAAGVPAPAIEQGLATFVPVKGRSRAQVIQVGAHRCTLVDDTYNANPDSVRAAIDVLADLPGPRLLVLGDMGEVGHQGPQFHTEAGRYAKARGIEHLKTLGELAACASAVFDGAQHYPSMESLVQAVQSELPRTASVLVKGSRFMRMERVTEALHAN